MTELLTLFSISEWIILAGLIVSGTILIRFYFCYYSTLGKAKIQTSTEQNEQRPISVVISGKNEYDNLKENLPFWLSQNYPKFEIVVVYDVTDDDILYLLRDFQQRHPQLKLVNFTKNVNFFDEQRFSISIGIKSAENEYVIVSTADCRPTNENYINSMQMGLSENTDVLAGYSSYTEKYSLLNSFARFHLFEKSVQFLSFALKGKIYAASHQNMIYRKDFFLQHQGYTSFYALKTGIYDLLANPIFNKQNVNVQLNPESITKTSGKLLLNNWFKREMQYFSVLRNAPKKVGIAITSYRSANFLFFLFLLLVGCNIFLSRNDLMEVFSLWFYICLFILIVKLSTQYWVMHTCMKKLKEKHFLLFIPLFEVLYLPLQLILFFLRLSPQLKKWK